VSARIQFQHVRYFLALAAERNFTRAATRCGVTQPSLTNAIKALELSLGGRLFERGPNGCRLTALGASLRPHFEQLQSGLERVVRIAGRFQGAGKHRTKDLSSDRSRPLVALGAAAAFACLAFAGPGAGWAGGHDVEAAIRDALPAEARCGRTAEPLFFCRYENPPEHSMVLDLSSGRDGPSASPTTGPDADACGNGSLNFPADKVRLSPYPAALHGRAGSVRRAATSAAPLHLPGSCGSSTSIARWQSATLARE
jgi:hypothetical protein